MIRMRNTTMGASLLCILLLAASPLPARAAGVADDTTAVLVTGASSGIGLKITEVLAADGQFVYAGARSAGDIEALNKLDNVEAVRLDVTNDEDIDAAVATVERSGRKLLGIVNNAGVAIVGPLIELELAELEWVFDVNVYGPYRITRAFAPLLLDAQGRVVNISSISGILSANFLGHYSMSKHALEAYTDSLAAELGPLGVSVSAIEPGNFNSNIGQTVRQRIDQGNIDVETSRFRERLEFLANAVEDRSRFAEPDAVARAVAHALFDEQPRRRYLVTSNQREAEVTIRKAIEELVQLNEGHAHSYSRDELVQLVDEALLQAKR